MEVIESSKRVAGCDLQRIVSAKSIMELNNVERFMATLSDKATHSNSIKTAAAARWCSTVNSLLTQKQVNALVDACISDDELDACIEDMIGYFDNVTGYTKKPKKGLRVEFGKGAFAKLNS